MKPKLFFLILSLLVWAVVISVAASVFIVLNPSKLMPTGFASTGITLGLIAVYWRLIEKAINGK